MVKALMSALRELMHAHLRHPMFGSRTFGVPANDDSHVVVSLVFENLPDQIFHVC